MATAHTATMPVLRAKLATLASGAQLEETSSQASSRLEALLLTTKKRLV